MTWETSLVGVAVGGAVLLPVVGLLAGALVPSAMSSFGTVVSGVGTMHATAAAGGVAATLQTTAATLATAKAAAIGGVAGAAVGAAFVPKFIFK